MGERSKHVLICIALMVWPGVFLRNMPDTNDGLDRLQSLLVAGFGVLVINRYMIARAYGRAEDA